jgi:uncharacterized FAD-dependent dehydrogenase
MGTGRYLVELARTGDVDDSAEALRVAVAETLALEPDQVGAVRLLRRALDARRRLRAPTWRLSVEAELDGGLAEARRLAAAPAPLPRLESPRAPAEAGPVVVVGAGPAGLFAAWHLAERGARVVLLERGKPVETRARDCGRLRGKGELDPESNLCFGEGGAGTYSDGKLTTRKRDPLVREVFERLVEVGAPERILTDAKPHVGTNLLFRTLRGLRARLIELGVDVRFQTRVERLRVEGGRVRGVELADGATLDAACVILATGHSARDTFETLLAQGVPMEPKAFAVGVRAEHPQALIDGNQYQSRGPRPAGLPAADYRLTHTEQGRGVYSFCMCPGGMVVPTATEPGHLVVNGMSSARRSSPYANSGVVVQVELADLVEHMKQDGPLVGVAFQRRLERAAFRAGGGGFFAPATRASDFIRRKGSADVPDSRFRPGLTPADLRECLPRFVSQALMAGVRRFDAQIRGYASREATLIGTETRTSSPIRIPRDPESFEVPGFEGLRVAGEGPGYAGGITSAAVDGLRAAHATLIALARLG